MITKFEFNNDEELDAILVIHRREMFDALKNINSYRRKLYKGEEREEIPTKEVEEELSKLLTAFYQVNAAMGY